MNISACFINAGAINFEKPEKMEELGVDVEYLTASTSNAFYRTNLNVISATKTDSDQDLPSSTTGAIVTKKINDEKESKLVVFSNAVFATDTKIQVANGYYIYRSTKKKSGYKKIHVVKKGKTQSYLDKKARKGKTYYYKIRTYKKAGGKKMQSNWSKVVRKKYKNS
mgnify:CR=1 FL=1